MIIDDKTYRLDTNNLKKRQTQIKRIVMVNSHNYGMNHFNGWQKRICGSYDKVTHFTVGKTGDIFQHVDTEYTTKVFGNWFRNTITNG